MAASPLVSRLISKYTLRWSQSAPELFDIILPYIAPNRRADTHAPACLKTIH